MFVSNVVDPGWVPTKMGGRGAPDDLKKGYETQVWLAVSNDEKAKLSGRYFFHEKERHHNPEADNVQLQERFLNLCKEMTSVSLPRMCPACKQCADEFRKMAALVVIGA